MIITGAHLDMSATTLFASGRMLVMQRWCVSFCVKHVQPTTSTNLHVQYHGQVSSQSNWQTCCNYVLAARCRLTLTEHFCKNRIKNICCFHPVPIAGGRHCTRTSHPILEKLLVCHPLLPNTPNQLRIQKVCCNHIEQAWKQGSYFLTTFSGEWLAAVWENASSAKTCKL